MAQVITSESPLVRASTPNEIAITPDVAANVSAARQGLVVSPRPSPMAARVPDAQHSSAVRPNARASPDWATRTFGPAPVLR